MISIRLFQLMALAGSLAVVACQPGGSENEETYQALYSAESGVALTQAAQDLLETNGHATSTIEMVVGDDIYSLSDEGLPKLSEDASYPLLVNRLQVGQIELIGSLSDGPDASKSWSCGSWQSVGCCYRGIQQRRRCCFSVDCYYQYRCLYTGGPC